MMNRLPTFLFLFILFLLLIDLMGADGQKNNNNNKNKNNKNKDKDNDKNKDKDNDKNDNKNNNNKKKNKKDDQTTAAPPAEESSGLSTTGKIVVGVLAGVVGLLAIGLVAMFCYFKKMAKVGSSFAGMAENGAAFNSPRPPGKPGPVVFDPTAPAYNPPPYNKFSPPVSDPRDLSGGYSGYRPEYPPPYSAKVPYGGAFSRLITQ